MTLSTSRSTVPFAPPRRLTLARLLVLIAATTLAVAGCSDSREPAASAESGSASPAASGAKNTPAASPPAPSGAGSSAAASGEVLRIGVIPKGTIHEFWKAVERGARDAATAAGATLLWDGPDVETAHDQQRRILENMLGAGANGIVIAPTDSVALQRPVESAVRSGIPVVIFDSNLAGDAFVSFVATDNHRGGVLGGERLAAAMTRAGAATTAAKRTLLLRYTEGSGSTRAREAGFEEAITGAGGVVVESQFTDGTTEGAITVATNMLDRHVKDGVLAIDGIFAANQPTSIGMLRALDRLAKQGITVEAKFVGFDASDELIRAVEAGAMEAIVVQDPYRMGRLAVETMISHLRGEAIEKRVDTGVTVVTRESLGEPAVRLLLGLDAAAGGKGTAE